MHQTRPGVLPTNFHIILCEPACPMVRLPLADRGYRGFPPMLILGNSPLGAKNATVSRYTLVASGNEEGRTSMGLLGSTHTVFAITALAVGLGVLVQEKGTRTHRRFGYVYAISLLLSNLTALPVLNITGHVGVFHILALVSLATLLAGFIPAFLRKPRRSWIHLHGHFMSWSYVGLMAAGVGQLTVLVSSRMAALLVGVSAFTIIVVGGLIIHTRVPRIIRVVVKRRDVA
jgi:uncharacterized membrane protein